MSLRTALETLPSDRMSRYAVREIVTFFSRHPDEWLSVEYVSRVTEVPQDDAHRVIDALTSAFVLDSDDDSGEYRYVRDALLELEIKRYLRRADTHTQLQRDNLEEFRRRFGER
jgi:hypothetical protein